MRLLVVFSALALSACSNFVTINDKTDGGVPRSFIVEGRLPKQSSDEMSEYLVRRISDEYAKISVMPFTGSLVAKMENEQGAEGLLSLPPKDRCVHLEVNTENPKAAQLEYIGLTLLLPGGKRIPLKPLSDSVERNEKRDYMVSQGLGDDDLRRTRVQEYRQFESKELRCVEDPQVWENGFALEVTRLYDVRLPKRILRWSVVRPVETGYRRAQVSEPVTVAPLGVVKRSTLK